jgi:hypothetical protein
VFVDGSAAQSGNGSDDAPFKTIGEAVKAIAGGDTITVRAGTYSESVTIGKSGTPESPTVLRAAPGARVILSGFKAITGWKEEAGGVYTTTVDDALIDFYVGLARQPVSRWPDRDVPMRYLVEPNEGVFRDRETIADVPALKSVAESPKSAMAFIFVAKGNYYTSIALKQLDPAGGKITVEAGKFFNNILGKNDRYQLINHPGLIQKPGQWAFEKLGDKQTKLYFKPANADDLKQTQYRPASNPRMVLVDAHKRVISNVRIEGLEVTGSGGDGIRVGDTQNVTVTRCLVHHNSGLGIVARGAKDVTISHNISVGNGLGISLASTEKATIEMNEIAANDVDGLVVAGDVSGRSGTNAETSGVTVRRNYIHHHMLLSHPDNMQTYRGVKDLTLDSNLLLWGGQGIMSEETQNAKVLNSVIVGTGAVAVIFGHGNSDGWTVEQSTVGLGGWGAFSLTGKDYVVRRSVVFNNPMVMGQNTTSDENLFAITNPGQPMFIVSKPKHSTYQSPEQVAAATGQEKQSVRIDEVPFRNAPMAQAVSQWADANTSNRLQVRSKAGSMFKAGDMIEVSGDGVLRKVLSVEDEVITFEPALPARPFRDSLVWNWGNAKSTQLDLRLKETLKQLPADGKVGATIDVAAYQRGDFDGDGKRDIPEVPEDVKANWPNPNDIVLPVMGT